MRPFLLPLLFILIMSAVPVSVNANSSCIERWDRACNDGNLFNGYWWRNEGWVPGLITQKTHFLPAPTHAKGEAVYYAAGVMEATAHYMGFNLDGYIDGVAMMSPADIGQTVWIRRDKREWEGPFLVVDSAELDDQYPIIEFRGEIIEVGWKTAKRWGILDEWKAEVEVFKSSYRPPIHNDQPIDYQSWFLEMAKFYSASRTQLPGRRIFRQPGEWYQNSEWISYLPQLGNALYVEPWIWALINDPGSITN